MKSALLVAASLVLALSVPGARADIGINPRVGTLGYGIELSAGFGSKFGLSLGFNNATFKTQQKTSDVDYDFDFRLRSADLLASYHPFSGAFRLRAGVLLNRNEFRMTGRPGASGYEFNGMTYTEAEVGTLTGKLSFNKSAPYVGIGWGNRPNGSFGLTFDVGAVYQGSPKLSLEATGGTATPLSLAADLEDERKKAEADLQSFKWYPVVSLGLYFRF